ncbi:MAG: GAF domain-containing protein, partial [Chloroflexota bacterium]
MKITDPNIQQILDTIDAHAVICDKTGVVVANTVASDWFGIDGDNVTVLKFEALIHPTSIQTVLNAYQSLKTGAPSATIRVAIQHPHLGNLWIDITAKPAKFVEDGRYWMMTFVPLRNLPLATDVAPESIGQQSIVQKDVVSAEPLLATVIEENYFVDTAIDNFFTNLQTLIPYDSCSISLAEPDGLRIIAARGLHEKVNINTLKIRQAKSIQNDTQILYQNGSTVYTIPDTQLSESWVNIEGTEAIRSWMGVELKYNQQVIGILNVDSYKPDFFTVEHAKFATTLVQQAILALIYTRLYKRFYDEVEEHRRLQHILVKNLISTETMFATQDLLYSSDNFATSLPTLMQILAASMDQTEIIVIIFNLKTKKLLHKLQTGQLNVDAWAIFTEIIDKSDLPYGEMPPQDIEFPSDNMMTLADERQVVVGAVNKCGALIAIREKSANAFDETDQELIVTIANQMTIAFHNELLTTQVRHQTEHLQRMVERRTSQLSVERKRLQAILDR